MGACFQSAQNTPEVESCQIYCEDGATYCDRFERERKRDVSGVWKSGYNLIMPPHTPPSTDRKRKKAS